MVNDLKGGRTERRRHIKTCVTRSSFTGTADDSQSSRAWPEASFAVARGGCGIGLRCGSGAERPARMVVAADRSKVDMARLARSLTQHADDAFELADTVLVGL